MAISKLVLAALLAAITCGFSAQACEFTRWFEFKGTTLSRAANSGTYIYTTSHKAVDADGAPNAYHWEDLGNHCADDQHRGLDCLAHAGYPRTDWWKQVLVADPEVPSRAYRQKSGAYQGFFVAKTWLEDPSRMATDINRYVDSRVVPYLVFPGARFPIISGTGHRGDLGYALNLANGKSTAFIIADKGGGADARLGEGSLALFSALGMPIVNSRTGSGLTDDIILYVVFPNSRSTAKPWPRSQKDISDHVSKLMDQIGGIEAVKSCF